VTKYRRGVFTAQVLHDLRNIFTSVCSDFESQLVEFDGEDDPVHLLVNYPPKITVAALVNSLKGVSSRLLRLKNHPASEACYGASRCGRRAPSPEVAVAHPSPLSDNTLSSNARLIERAGNAFGVRAILPPEGRGLPRVWVKAAEQMGDRYRTGLIQKGLLADVVVLDRNPYKVPVTDIHNIKVKLTLINGEVVYRAGQPAT
jgi:hypothetical protein